MNRVHDILAVRPPGTSTVIHLELPGYQPAAARSGKTRLKTEAVLCNAFVKADRSRVPLTEATGWTAPPGPGEPHEQWRWCRHCLGHLVELAGLETLVLTTATGGVVDPPRQPVRPLPGLAVDQIHRATGTIRAVADALDRLTETP